MKIGRGFGMPDWITGHIAFCGKCDDEELIIELHDARGTYFHCVNCNSDLDVLRPIQ